MEKLTLQERIEAAKELSRRFTLKGGLTHNESEWCQNTRHDAITATGTRTNIKL